MDTLVDSLTRGVEQLPGRASGPMHLRLVVIPAAVTTLAILPYLPIRGPVTRLSRALHRKRSGQGMNR